MIILGSTDARPPKGMAPVAIGLGLTPIHLIGIPGWPQRTGPLSR